MPLLMAINFVADYFQPDVIVTQNGADAHYYDPLTHLSLTMDAFRTIPKLAHEIAHQYCGGKWIAVGGGGYDIWRVIPRAWSLIWLEMKNKSDINGPLPKSWLNDWAKQTSISLIENWDDPQNMYKPIPRKKDIEEKNKQMVERALYFVRNQLTNDQ